MNYLVVIDMQNDFINGALGSESAQVIVPKVVDKIKNFEGMIITTKDSHNNNDSTIEAATLPKHCVRGTDGWALHPDIRIEVAKNKWLSNINKVSFMATTEEWNTHIPHTRQGLVPEVIEICGLCTDICVISNALAIRNTFPYAIVRVDASCCAGTSPEAHEAAIRIMRSNLIEVYNCD